MATPNVFGIRETPLVTFYDLATNKALVQLTNVKTAGLENKGEVIYARGGRGNPKIMGFNGNREGTVKLQDALFTTQVLAMMTGNGLVTASQNIYTRDALTVATNSATLRYTPVNTGALIGVYKLNADNTHGTELVYTSSTLSTGKYSISGKNISLFSGDIANGGQIVAYYQNATDPTASKISITSDKFSGTYKVVMDCLVRDAVTQNDFAAQVIIYNAKMTNDWSLSMASTGDPSNFDLDLEILKPQGSSTAMWDMIVYDQTLLT